jgi:FAD/FMN-containing dehydrogenase
MLARDLSGPRRYGHGTIREHLIGVTVVLADGRIVKSGGRVVKNVAGYDLCKLFVGARNTLGVIVEANFKLHPKPETELFLQCRPDSPRANQELLMAIRQSPLDPAVLDLDGMTDPLQPAVVVGLEGSAAQVDWQRDQCGHLGITRTASLDYEARFWDLPPEPVPRSISDLPSQLLHAVHPIQNAPWMARAGNGLIWHRSALESAPSRLPAVLLQRVKSTFDPNQVFPANPW